MQRSELHEVLWGITAQYRGTCMSSISLTLNGAAFSSFTKYWLGFRAQPILWSAARLGAFILWRNRVKNPCDYSSPRAGDASIKHPSLFKDNLDICMPCFSAQCNCAFWSKTLSWGFICLLPVASS